MTFRRWFPAVVLAVLFAATGIGLHATRLRAQAPPPPEGGEATARQPGGDSSRRQRLVDTQPLLTARRLAALATAPEEQELARQAQRLADHAVDLAFAEALQRIADSPPAPTPELRALAEAKQAARERSAAARARVDSLTRELASHPAADRGEEQLEVAKAQVELASDELDEASEQLARAGGDPQALIQRLRAGYEAAQTDPQAVPAAPPAAGDAAAPASVLGRVRAWTAQREKAARLEAARREALDRVERLTRRSERITGRIQSAEALERNDPAASQGVAAADRAAAIRGLAQDRRRITGIGRRLQDFQELAEVYADWTALVEGHTRTALHRVLQGASWVLLVLALVFLAGRLIDHLFRGVEEEALRAGTLRGVARVAVQVAGVLVVLFVVLGTPSEVTTIVGLAGAGLTVALKDFLVAFFGWFVLMGRNGVRVGDWVEIKGVGGEVAEIGLLHTVLLETGSWTGAGHPTGRRVSFVNSFAVEGHFFNFSTSGQWLWDTLQVLVPVGQDPYPVIDGIQRLVERETEANAKLAEQEWQKITTRYRVRTFSAVPGINVVPTSTGVQLEVRYITHAYERHETRQRLYHAVVELMHGKRGRDAGASAR